MSLFNRFRQLISRWKPAPQWAEIERFDPAWKTRMAQMAALIPSEAQVVVDLGCGPMWLKEFLSPGLSYHPVDYRDRGNGTIVCDFNQNQFPNIPCDVAFVGGCLEYVTDYEWFVAQITQYASYALLSYCTLEAYPDLQERRNNAWVNHLTEASLIDLFTAQGFQLIRHIRQPNSLFLFQKQGYA